MDQESTYSIGVVNWFGGENRQTGKVNNFGFISSYLSEDFYVNKNDLTNGNLVEGQFVLFEEQQQKNGKKSATNVHILYPKLETVEPPEHFLELLSIASGIANLVAKFDYKNHLVDWLNGPHGEIVLKHFNKEMGYNNSYLDLINRSDKSVELFCIYTDNSSIAELYESNIDPEFIPTAYLINNIKNIVSWWYSLRNVEHKKHLFDKGLSFLIRKSKVRTDLSVIYNNDELKEIVKYIREEFPLEQNTVEVINKLDSSNTLMNEYLKGTDIQTLLNNKISIFLLPECYVSNEINAVIGRIQQQNTAKDVLLDKEILNLIVNKASYIESLLHDSSDEIALSFTRLLANELPLNMDVITCISESERFELLFREYSKNFNLEDFIQSTIFSRYFLDSTPFTKNLPKWYLDEQIDAFFNDLEKANAFIKAKTPNQTLSFILSSPTYRIKAMKACGSVHLTNIVRLVSLLSDQDKAIEIKLLERVNNCPLSVSDIPSILPLLPKLGNDFMSNHIDEMCSWLSSLDGADKVEQLPNVIHFFDTSSLLALIFKGALTTNDIGNRIHEVDSFVLTILRKQKADVAPYVRDAYKNRFTSFSDFSSHPVFKPLIAENTIVIKKEQIKWQVYNKDLSFVYEIENTPEIAFDPEFFILAKMLPLINERNTYTDIESVVLHEIWQGLLNGSLDLNHPGLMTLFPACGSLPSNLSCEAFYWKTLEYNAYTKKYQPEKVYLCRSTPCRNPQVEPDLNKSYLNYNIYDWLSHYGVNYEHYSQPSKRDFAIKFAGYINRIKELHSRLNCRCCGTLMKPNMKYARVEATRFDPKLNKFVTFAVQAAYRMTVFHCGNESCAEFNNNYYINHCLGFKCYELIDSRDIEDKCDEGRYICPECKSCCSKHRDKYGHVNNGESDPIKHKNRYGSSPFIYNRPNKD
ncbi:hypothetical protein [Shewanella morhuae]|uniref:hypothetical protein n=1 Tax=Shewanella morhuae TaxID=365591 RepID=UPI001BBFEFB2|nr:hypothetical protein [Shewanella morhuae]GIU01796.1 hypothetical protein TUM4641_00630 [Shewanella morhuae]